MGLMLIRESAIPLLDSWAVGIETGTAEMDRLSAANIPFIFVVNAWADRWVVKELPDAISSGIRWNLDGRGTLGSTQSPPAAFRFDAQPVPLERYSRGFEIIHQSQIRGESWLANLTFPSILDTDLSLDSLAECASAPFRLLVPGQLAVFSPERFVRISEDGIISSYPMKGTIDAALPGARQKILADEKESAEHITIVDLIRNDIGMVAGMVSVPRYRFITEVKARGCDLLQVSSEISGELERGWRQHTGSIMGRLLPAGSVTGAPKKRTGEIIRDAEAYERGWYTGVFGVFDGRTLDSAVMIRFAEKTVDGALYYKSGGGITIYSDMESEYAELKAKIYAPFS